MTKEFAVLSFILKKHTEETDIRSSHCIPTTVLCLERQEATTYAREGKGNYLGTPIDMKLQWRRPLQPVWQDITPHGLP